MIKYRSQLPELMKELTLPLTGVEVGCAEGYFSADLLREGIQLLYMVDNWGTIGGQLGDGGAENEWHLKNYKQALDRMSAFDNTDKKYKVLKGLSADMARHVPDNSLSLVYIDCDHSYEGVKADIKAWFSKLITGGIMAFHDYENDSSTYGVKKAVTEFCDAKGYSILLIPENKAEDAGAYFIKQ